MSDLERAAVKLARAETHDQSCSFHGSTCGAVEKRAELRAEVLRLARLKGLVGK